MGEGPVQNNGVAMGPASIGFFDPKYGLDLNGLYAGKIR